MNIKQLLAIVGILAVRYLSKHIDCWVGSPTVPLVHPESLPENFPVFFSIKKWTHCKLWSFTGLKYPEIRLCSNSPCSNHTWPLKLPKEIGMFCMVTVDVPSFTPILLGQLRVSGSSPSPSTHRPGAACVVWGCGRSSRHFTIVHHLPRWKRAVEHYPQNLPFTIGIWSSKSSFGTILWYYCPASSLSSFLIEELIWFTAPLFCRWGSHQMQS